MNRQWPPQRRIELFESMITSLKDTLRDPTLTPRNVQSVVTSIAILSDKLRAEEGKLSPYQHEGVGSSSGSFASGLNIAKELDAIDAKLREEIDAGSNESSCSPKGRLLPADDDE